MKYFILLSVAAFALVSCTSLDTTERKPVPPKGSDESDMPWNTPQNGEGGGMLGGMLNNQIR